jgi:hypothetical protein
MKCNWTSSSEGFKNEVVDAGLCCRLRPQFFMSGNAGRQKPAIGTFDDGFEGLGPSRESETY